MNKFKWKWICLSLFIVLSLLEHLIKNVNIVHISLSLLGYEVVPILSEAGLFGGSGFLIGWGIELWIREHELKEEVTHLPIVVSYPQKTSQALERKLSWRWVGVISAIAMSALQYVSEEIHIVHITIRGIAYSFLSEFIVFVIIGILSGLVKDLSYNNRKLEAKKESSSKVVISYGRRSS